MYKTGDYIESIKGFQSGEYWVEKWCLGIVDSQSVDSVVNVRWEQMPEKVLISPADCIQPAQPAVPAKPDMVNHPTHYTSSPAKCSKCGHGIECIDVVQHMGFSIGNAVKYLWRAGLKNDAIEDLKKAVWYINAEIAKREKSEQQR
jgi:hypothetical protein